MTKEEFDTTLYYKQQPCRVRRILNGQSSKGPIWDEGYIMGVDFPERKFRVTIAVGNGKVSSWVTADRVALK